MRKKYLCIATAVVLTASVAGCGAKTAINNNQTSIVEENSTSAEDETTKEDITKEDTTEVETTIEEATTEDASSYEKEITGDFTIVAENGSVVEEKNGVYTITKADNYTITGVLSEGQIIVDAGEEDVDLIFNNASITSKTSSPVYIKSAGKVKIKAEEGSYNVIADNREAKTDSSDDTEENAAIFANADLSFAGKGAMVITSTYNNGVQSKNDVSVKNITLKIKAVNNAIKGKDSVTVESGDIILISSGGDGIKTVDSDVSSKGNQRGTISILGGNISIYSACDGLDSSYNVEIAEGTNLNVYTDSYSNYTGDVSESDTSDFYLVMSDYSEDYDYYVYYYKDDDSDGKIVKGTYYSTVRGGAQGTYYALVFDAPSGYDNMMIYRYKSGADTTNDEYDAVSTGDKVNSSMNGYLISDFNNGKITGDWVNLSSGNSGNNSSKSIYSAKGIKAANEIIIDGGTIYIKANDDGIHANDDETLENGEEALGNITINGGDITIEATDDGIHADEELTVNGGKITVTTSYEGLEANVITINGGEQNIYATDDAVNACAGNTTPLVKVTGGTLTVKTPSGDTDAIDSNGNYEQTGGTVLVQGGSTMGNVAGSVDVDGKITVTGGIIVALGGICETPQNSNNAYASSSTSLSAGKYEITCDGKTIYSFTLTESYSGFWVCSKDLVTGKTCALTKDGTEVVSWTQEDGTMGSSGGGFGGFGGGGFGGGHGGPGGH